MKPIHKATIDDVAELAGVSIKTVSRVVNHEPNVRESTREKVERAIHKLDYRPNLSARNLASQRSHIIVLVYDDPSKYELPSLGYVTSMQEGALRACKASDCELLIHPCNYRNSNVTSEITTLIARARPDGVVLAAPLSNMPKIVDAIAATDTPLVRISPGKKSRQEYTVVTDDRETSAEMTRYLASLGHKRIGFIKGHPQHLAVGERFLGYQDGLKAVGLEFSAELVAAGDNSFGSGEACAAKLLGRKHPPTAIFAANDDMAAGVIRAADRLGLAVPEQLSVAGFDDVALARQIHPTLTTVRQPLAVMAEKAVSALVAQSGKRESLRGPEVVPGTLQIRESAGPAPT